jgi:hypothetical protein
MVLGVGRGIHHDGEKWGEGGRKLWPSTSFIGGGGVER